MRAGAGFPHRSHIALGLGVGMEVHRTGICRPAIHLRLQLRRECVLAQRAELEQARAPSAKKLGEGRKSAKRSGGFGCGETGGAAGS
ncbi:hypothetical protein EEDFHM_02046 [Methylorubrum populi]